MKVTVTGNKMVIEVDLTAGTPSKSGKSIVVASTNGFVDVEGDLKLSLNVIKTR